MIIIFRKKKEKDKTKRVYNRTIPKRDETDRERFSLDRSVEQDLRKRKSIAISRDS